MNPEYFAQEMEAMAKLAKEHQKYENFELALRVAVKSNQKEFSVKTDSVFPADVLDELGYRGIICKKAEDDDGGVTTYFDFSKVGDPK